MALVTNIESQEWVRRDRAGEGRLPEHPRASSSDDVECFFSVMRDLIGHSFTVKAVFSEWRKINYEYSKRLDSRLPFYYHSSSHSRFFEGENPQFNDPVNDASRLEAMRPARREMGQLHAAGKASITTDPVRRLRAVRQRFHNNPVPLPPPPALDIHDYCT